MKLYKELVCYLCNIMYIQAYDGTIIKIDITKFNSDKELHSFIWKTKYNIEFIHTDEFLKKCVENVF